MSEDIVNIRYEREEIYAFGNDVGINLAYKMSTDVFMDIIREEAIKRIPPKNPEEIQIYLMGVAVGYHLKKEELDL